MSIRIMTMVFDRYPEGGNERLLALAISDESDDTGCRVFPSVARLADRSKQSERSVQRLMSRMLSTGWLILVRKSSGRRGDCTEYRISPEWIAGGDPVPPATVPDRRTTRKSTGVKLAPVQPPENAPAPVDNLSTTGDTQGLSGDTTGLSGDTAVSPNPVLPFITLIPPLPPVATGGLLKSQKSEQPDSQPQSQAKPRWRWRESRKEIDAMGVRLGLGAWDEAAFNTGSGEQYPAYKARVLKAYEVWEASAAAQSQRSAMGARH